LAQKPGSFIKGLFDSQALYMQSQNSEFEKEFKAYLAAEYDKAYNDPLDFFRSNHKKYSILARLVKHLFCLTASSFPSECLFSHAGKTMTNIRNRLDTDNLEMLVLIKDNLE